jgi:hypothetical protein
VMSDVIRAVVALDNGINGEFLQAALPAGPELQIVSVVERLDDSRHVLKAPDKNAWKFAFASEYGKVWIVLRSKAGAEQSAPSLVTLQTVLFGSKPIRVK